MRCQTIKLMRFDEHTRLRPALGTPAHYRLSRCKYGAFEIPCFELASDFSAGKVRDWLPRLEAGGNLLLRGWSPLRLCDGNL